MAHIFHLNAEIDHFIIANEIGLLLQIFKSDSVLLLLLL